jgi:translation initiation factor IF-3
MNVQVIYLELFLILILQLIKTNLWRRTIETSEIQLRPNIAKHDLLIKVKDVSRLLDKGNRVRIVVKFKGREVTHPELGKSLIGIVINAVAEVNIIKPANLDGNRMTALIERKK